MPQTRTTGFLDLPLELRQEVYLHLIPSDRVIYFPATQYRRNAEKTTFAVCATDPDINDELEEFLYEECGAQIMVTPHEEMGLPSALEWHRFQSITVYIGHSTPTSNCPGIRELICGLGNGRPKILPEITILFDEVYSDDSSRRRASGDSKWIVKMPTRTAYYWRGNESDYDEKDYHIRYKDPIANAEDIDADPYEDHNDYGDTWLRTVNDHYGNPIAVELLDYFLTLPPCRSATVFPLDGPSTRRHHLPRHDPKARIFDEDYMEDL